MSTDDTSESDAQHTNDDEPTSVVNMTAYAPVRMESIDTAGATTTVETPTPVGRRRIADKTNATEDRVVEIPHESCDHILVAGLPRRGKDSFLASVGKNLKDEHGYSYVSIMDDGRMETPMISLPSDDGVVRDALDTFDQTPEGMDAEVFVPATGELPVHLPANFKRFTIGPDTVSEAHRDDLSGTGILRPPGTETNLDMEAVLADQERAAVLCCNFLSEDQHGLKYTLMDAWLQLIYQARDENPRLPRVCLEAREIKHLAPSRLQDSAFPDRVKSLRETMEKIAVQGGSRRILLLGSTQNLSDVYTRVRENMPTRVLLQLGVETIDTLDRLYHFSDEQKRALGEFNIGMGMLIFDGRTHWPIEFRPSPCAVGDGDRHWLDRYGSAWGARVRGSATDVFDSDWWASLPDATVHHEGAPDIGDWYLLPEDFPENTDVEDIDRDHVESVLKPRRSDGLHVDCSLTLTDEL